MMLLLFVGAVVVLVAVVAFERRWRDPEKRPHRITPAARRILFPFVGETVSQRALDAALRLSRAEGATLVPAYILTVPLSLNLDAPAPGPCGSAMALLEAIERRASRLHVPVDSRIETGRTARHALRRLAEHETYDRIVIPASDSREGFSADDIAWLLENVDGEILVLRPAGREHLGHHIHRNGTVLPRHADAA
jgi:nucleotide-binding universal stress UspA family protein